MAEHDIEPIDNPKENNTINSIKNHIGYKTYNSKHRLIALCSTIVLVLVSLYFYNKPAKQQPQAQSAPGFATPNVNVAEVLEKDVSLWHEFSGRLVAVQKVEIKPRISGVIKMVNFTNGALVNQDDLLFTIDDDVYIAEANRTKALLTSKAARLDLANTELKRAELLIKDKSIPQSEFDTKKNEYNVSLAELKSLEAELESNLLNLEYTKIKAPISGRVSRAEITEGNLVEAGPNARILTTIVSHNPIYADFEVDEATYLNFVTKKQEKHVADINSTTNNTTETSQDHANVPTNHDAGQNQNDTSSKVPVIMSVGGEDSISYSGYIDAFDNSVNTASGTIRARAIFENPDANLVPGLFVRIKLGNANTSKVVLIDDKAIGTDQNKKFVYVVDNENKVNYREIKTGDLSDGLRIVMAGLNKGEKIIVNGLQKVRPGASVAAELVSMQHTNSDEKIAPAAGN